MLCSDVRSDLIFRRSKPVGENIKLFTCDLVSFNIRMFFILLWCVLVLEIPDLTWFLRILSEYKAKTPKNVSFTIETIVFHSSSGAIQHGARSENMTYFRLQFLIGPSITMLYPVLVYISGCSELSFSWSHILFNILSTLQSILSIPLFIHQVHWFLLVHLINTLPNTTCNCHQRSIILESVKGKFYLLKM